MVEYRSIDDRAFHRVAADLVIRDGEGRIVLIRRKFEPFEDTWCLPGGHVEEDEQVRDAAVREAREETGLDIEIQDILGVYDAPERDPRGPVISIVFIADATGGTLRAETDAEEARWFALNDLPDELGFDHETILDDFMSRD
ncbi:MAG: NUDIX hydrolase [Candidatus Nanohaloarchaea archaeon]|nr:NUDIX hydrolase [Candidatus Nanohaloarchaea archaeon]